MGMKWGILSTADINRLVIPRAHESPKVDLVGVASRDQARAEEDARKWEIQRAYGSYEHFSNAFWEMIAAASTSQAITPTSPHVFVG